MSLSKTINDLIEHLSSPINKSAVILVGLYTILWGLWVLSPFWSVFTSAPLYSAMLGVIPAEWFWGTVAIICGSLTVRGAITLDYRQLLIGTYAVACHWFVIAIFYFIGDWHNTGGITAAFLAVYGAYLYLNIRFNHNKDK